MDAVPPAPATPPTPTLAEDPALGLDQRRKMEILGAVLLGMFLSALDQTIVGTALPRIVTELGGNDLYTWVITIYLLTATISVPFYGKLSDIYGRKPLLMIGITTFLVGSALSGLSQEMWQLILFRGLQGLGAGALFPIALAIIGDLFTPAERGKYQGLFGAVFGLSSIIGPALGGFLTDNISWHWIFYVNIPIGLVSLYVIARLLPTIKRPDIRHSLDYAGAAVFTVAVGFLLVGLTNKQFGDWAELEVGGFIGLGVALGLVFLAIEARAKEPIVPLDLWRNRTYASSIMATFFISFGFFGAIIFLPRWFQFVKEISATESGYQILPLLVGLIISSIVAGQLVSRTGRSKPIVAVGIVLMSIGIFLMTGLTTETELPVLWLWMFITGLGIGPTFSVFTIVVQNAVPFQKLGVATSNLTFFRQIGGSVGLAIAGTLFGSRLAEEIPNQLTASGVPAPIVDQFAAGAAGSTDELVGVGGNLGERILAGVPEAVRPMIEPLLPNIVAGIHDAFSISVAGTFWLALLATGAAFAATLVMRELPLRTTHGAPPADRQAAPEGERATGTVGGIGPAGVPRVAESPALD
jgi:EmrB/QacA subfamily drug resistance transporter